MNGKSLIQIHLPATDKSYDMWVPLSMRLHEAEPLIEGILTSKEKDFFIANSKNTFMLKESGEILDQNSTIEELDLGNGSQVVLI